jgi:hypothetical protein
MYAEFLSYMPAYTLACTEILVCISLSFCKYFASNTCTYVRVRVYINFHPAVASCNGLQRAALHVCHAVAAAKSLLGQSDLHSDFGWDSLRDMRRDI